MIDWLADWLVALLFDKLAGWFAGGTEPTVSSHFMLLHVYLDSELSKSTFVQVEMLSDWLMNSICVRLT